MQQTKQQRYTAKLLAQGYVRRSYILPPCVAGKVAAYVAACMAEYREANPPPTRVYG